MANFNTFKSVNDLLKAFPTEKSCIKYNTRSAIGCYPENRLVS